MKELRKKLVICINPEAASVRDHEWQIGLSFSPSASSTRAQDAVDLEVVLSGAEGEVQKHFFRNLAEFRFYIRYGTDADESLSESVSEHAGTDEWRLDEIRRRQMPDLSETSYLCDFSDISSVTRTLATVSFIGSNMEKREGSFLNVAFGEESGNALSVSMGTGNERGTGDSDSAKMLALGCGLIGLAKLKRRLGGRW